MFPPLYILHTSYIWFKFDLCSSAVTLKIKAWSQKTYQVFNMSQYYIHANLVPISQPVHEISCTKERATATLMPIPLGSIPTPCRWGLEPSIHGLVPISQPVHEISCIKERAPPMLMPTPLGSTPTPCQWGLEPSIHGLVTDIQVQ